MPEYVDDFNSHPREEDDPWKNKTRTRKQDFNSHPREEDDDSRRYGRRIFHYFNSHPREEDDRMQAMNLTGIQ